MSDYPIEQWRRSLQECMKAWDESAHPRGAGGKFGEGGGLAKPAGGALRTVGGAKDIKQIHLKKAAYAARSVLSRVQPGANIEVQANEGETRARVTAFWKYFSDAPNVTAIHDAIQADNPNVGVHIEHGGGFDDPNSYEISAVIRLD